MTMTLFPDATVALLRQLNEDNLQQVASIEDFTSSRGPGAVTAQSWLPVLTVPCRLSPITADERFTGDQLLAQATWYVVLPAGTPVNAKQRIVVTGTTTVDGIETEWSKTLAIVGVPAPRANEAMRKVLCKDA